MPDLAIETQMADEIADLLLAEIVKDPQETCTFQTVSLVAVDKKNAMDDPRIQAFIKDLEEKVRSSCNQNVFTNANRLP